MNSVLRRRVAWLTLAGVAFAGLPWTWSTTLLRWLQFGASASWRWPLATFGLAALAVWLCRWLGASSRPPRSRGALLSVVAAWCLAHAACWHWRVSALGHDPLVMLAYLVGTCWLGWCGAMFFTPLIWSARLRTFAALLLPLTAWLTALESHGADGSGRPIVRWRISVAARGAMRYAALNTTARSDRDGPATTAGTTGAPVTRAGTTGAPATRAGATFAQNQGDAQGDYPGFRGRDGLAKVEGVRLARDWSARPPRLIWRASVGGGWSGFAIAKTRAFTQEQRGDNEAVVCYDLATGRERWVHTDAACFRDAIGGAGPRATPAVCEGEVYSLGATGILNCLDAATGRRRWSVDVVADNDASNLFHGLSGSPLIVDGAVVVGVGGRRGRSLAAYDRRTGQRRIRGGDDPAGY
ncbi:MAG: PQQ-binding-like beta-propeller repeat protein, partial [Candidatus Saccharimonadales bacterium]